MHQRVVLFLLLSMGLQAQAPAPKVRWQPWAGASFAQGKREGKPVLVDAEATWCHWCHVMEAKTYGDPEVAALVNASFVAIKADIDQHPDAQELYSDIGWPGTTLYAPDGTVLWRHRGYITKEDFLPILNRIAKGDRTPWKGEEPAAASTTEGGDALAWGRKEVDRVFDENRGGWGRQKYPIAMNLEELFRRASEGDDSARYRALYTLSQQRHITDPVWGGIFQYSAGPDWHQVHFEKLATLQAGYLENLAEAYRATKDEDWRRDAEKVLRFLHRFFQQSGGGFSATVDADLGGHGAAKPRMLGKDYYALSDQARVKAGLPRTDVRRYAQVQGLMISALAHLSAAMEDPQALDDARRTMAYAEKHLREGEGYLHAEGQPGVFFLQDQAAMLKGALALFEVTQDVVHLRRAQALAAFIQARFSDDQGLYLARYGGTEALPVANRRPADENLLLARAFIRMHAFTGEEMWRDRAKAIADRLCTIPGLDAQGRWLGDALLLLAELKEDPPHLVVSGAIGDSRTQDLLAEAQRLWMPGVAILHHDPSAGEPLNPELSFPTMAQPAAFLCGKGTCSKPLLTAEAIEQERLRRR
jgi:uncharacterized protein YyaL (SSP411 family)